MEPITILMNNFLTAEIDQAAKKEKLDRGQFISKAAIKYLVEVHGKEQPKEKEPIHHFYGLDFFTG